MFLRDSNIHLKSFNNQKPSDIAQTILFTRKKYNCKLIFIKIDELDGANGVQSAARRRINYELGIETSNLNLNQFEYITRIQYHADNSPYDGIFGEHEIDYCLILKGNYKLIPSMNEVKAYRYLSMYQLKEFVDQGNDHNSGVLLTPWFKMICEKFLFEWWQNLDHLESVKDHLNIHKLN